MRERLALLTHLVPSLSIFNVWGLPLWLWRDYERMHDTYVRERRERGGR